MKFNLNFIRVSSLKKLYYPIALVRDRGRSIINFILLPISLYERLNEGLKEVLKIIE